MARPIIIHEKNRTRYRLQGAAMGIAAMLAVQEVVVPVKSMPLGECFAHAASHLDVFKRDTDGSVLFRAELAYKKDAAACKQMVWGPITSAIQRILP